MSINYAIPKTAHFLQTVNVFTAEYNKVDGAITGSGQYDFGQAINVAQVVIPMEKGAIYFVDTFNVGGTIPEEHYFFNISTLPLATLKMRIEAQRIYRRSLPIVNFISNQQAAAWFWSQKDTDALTMDFSGVLNQNADLVGVTLIKINVALNIYEITDNGFIQDFLSDNSVSGIGQRTSLQQGNKVYVR
jgi:hypothetical protein